jgi:hypothetical protein
METKAIGLNWNEVKVAAWWWWCAVDALCSK